MNINLHIERLVLEGFAPGDRYRIKEAMERELTRLMAEQGLPVPSAHTRQLASLDAGTFSVAAGAKANSIGAQVAHAVYGGLGSQIFKEMKVNSKRTKTIGCDMARDVWQGTTMRKEAKS